MFQAPGGDTDSITVLGGDLKVSVRDEAFCCPPPSIFKLVTLMAAVLDSFELGFLFERVTGLSNDGSDMIMLPGFSGPKAVFVDPKSGSQGDRAFLLRYVRIHTGRNASDGLPPSRKRVLPRQRRDGLPLRHHHGSIR